VSRRRAPALERSVGKQLGVPAGEIGELRRRLAFLESLVAAFDESRDAQSTAEIIGRLAVSELASACWIYLRDVRHGLRLAYAAQSDSAMDPGDVPEDLRARIAILGRASRRRFSTPPGDASRVLLPLEAEGVLFGAIALIPERAPMSSSRWTIDLLADQAAKALARARSYEAAKRAVRVRDEAIAAAGHELGNSLGALRLQIHALLRGELAQKSASPLLQRLHSMERQVIHLISLNQRMLAPSRLKHGFEPKLERIDLSEIIREVLAREADQLAWRRCPVEFTGKGPVVGLWDRWLLDQIFSNLLSNAMKYGHGKPISVALKTTKAIAFLEVRDEGIGIAMEDQGRIFEKFERAAAIEIGASLGLGLWIAREMVLALGGAIRVQSAIGAGSTFVVELPRGARAPRREGKTT
jgi:signal transduction histidine kinase